MTKKRFATVIGIVGLLTTALVFGYFKIDKLAGPYKESNSTWRIHGLCRNAQDRIPIRDAEITVYFTEPVEFKNHWRNPPPLMRTNVVMKTDEQGRFEALGKGGSVGIRASAEGYVVETWSHSARNQTIEVDTNLVLDLKPVRGERQSLEPPTPTNAAALPVKFDLAPGQVRLPKLATRWLPQVLLFASRIVVSATNASQSKQSSPTSN